jgi:uncharacterized membrane protein
MWNAAMGTLGLVFWVYAVLTILMPEVFGPRGYILGILGGMLAIFMVVTQIAAGTKSVDQAWDESTEHDSNRAYKFGFIVACLVYVVFWLPIAQGWVPVEAALPAMGAFTGGSYCLFLGLSGLRGWLETRNAPD